MRRIRRYVDTEGKPRRLVFVKLGPFVKWHRFFPASLTEQWHDESDALLQVPINAWKCYEIKYEDEVLTVEVISDKQVIP